MTIKRQSLMLLPMLSVALGVCTYYAAAQTAAPVLTTLHSFHGATRDGSAPISGVAIGAGGVLYGTTGNGGPPNLGTVFSLTRPSSPGGSWSEIEIYSFSGPDGAVPVTTLAIGSGEVLYGATAQGGTGSCSGGCGAVFSLARSSGTAWTETVLYSFTGGSDGSSPTGLALGSHGVLYGTTNNIASPGVGTVFSLTPPAEPGGTWTENVLHAFSGPDGGDPVGGVVQAGGGALYGTTSSGGATDVGVVFRLAPPASAGGAWVETVLHSFTGADGAFPSAGVAIGSGGILYGTTSLAGSFGDGTAYALAPPVSGSGGAWTITVLHTFSGSDGNSPAAPLAIGSGGVLFGTTTAGGAANLGTVFALLPPATTGGAAWTETVLHSFTGDPQEGSAPYAGLAIGNGALFGTTTSGGTANLGTVFALR
ncbi:MAG: choice-of-anchor tandem repeat GloVer-containing protein [Bryobacteraceae bacterium]